MVSEPNARTLFEILDILTYFVYVLLVVMPETAVSSSTSSRPSKQYRCSLCDKPFDSAETLDSHQKFEHSEPGHRKPVAGVG
ncbi:MAG TPA: C2H2-type zinc finger protein [Nitrososphaeraceae archaeon]|nr:C2H2-type zinc finger protein [Nitrososphaeraceae archaeon]